MRRDTKLLINFANRLCNELDTHVDLYCESRGFIPKQKNFNLRTNQNKKNIKYLLNQIDKILESPEKNIISQAKIIFS